MKGNDPEGSGVIDGAMVELYDVFVDWPSRLAREMPGVEARLQAIGARRVLDVGCGTGRHVAALADRGYEIFGSDGSPAMINRAHEHCGRRARLVEWRLEEPVPGVLTDAAPFDAVLALGNVWPQLVTERAGESALASVRSLLRDGGMLLLGLKAFAIRKESGNPYLPLLRRTHEGRTLFFVRFMDFASDSREDVARMHFVILGDGREAANTVIDHRVVPMRVWSAQGLEAAVRAAGFSSVAVSGAIGDPGVAPTTEDVFVHALR